MKLYSRPLRLILGALVLLLFVVGVVMNPAKILTTLVAIPVAFASALLWVIVTLALVWLVVDLAAKYLLGKSLREHIADKDPKFEQNLVVAMVIVVALAMLIAK